jgi:hypothetical protein
MISKKLYSALLTVMVLGFSCSENESPNDTEPTLPVTEKLIEKPIEKPIEIEGLVIPTRMEPGNNFDKKLNEKAIEFELKQSDYEILKTNHNSAVQNFDVLLKHSKFDKEYLYQFTKQFRAEKCTISCNISLYDSKSIRSLISVYPLNKNQYLKLADHFLSMSTFDAVEVKSWYPYQDVQYEEYGGKNWK